jgi:hypothetical protein
MVKHHVLIGLGFKKNNFRNRALRYMIDKPPMRLAVMPRGSGLIPSNQITIMPVAPSMSLQKLSRKPLNFNY